MIAAYRDAEACGQADRSAARLAVIVKKSGDEVLRHAVRLFTRPV
jgi:hypothetical protein